MATVYIPAQLRELTAGIEYLDVDATNVRGIVSALDEQFPGIQARLCSGDALAPSLQVSIDGVMTTRGLLAKVKPNSEVHFIPAIGGG